MRVASRAAVVLPKVQHSHIHVALPTQASSVCCNPRPISILSHVDALTLLPVMTKSTLGFALVALLCISVLARSFATQSSSTDLITSRLSRTVSIATSTLLELQLPQTPTHFPMPPKQHPCHQDCGKTFKKAAHLKLHQESCTIWLDSQAIIHQRRRSLIEKTQEQRAAAFRRRHGFGVSVRREKLFGLILPIETPPLVATSIYVEHFRAIRCTAITS